MSDDDAVPTRSCVPGATGSPSCCGPSGPSSGRCAAGSSAWPSRCCSSWGSARSPGRTASAAYRWAPTSPRLACPAPPTGPGGEWVTDSFYFVRQPLAGNGSITVRVTSLTGLYSTQRRVRIGPEPDGGDDAWRAAVVQGRDHRQGEHPPGVGVRGDDGHRKPRRADAVGLHPRRGRAGREGVRGLAALAPADPFRRHDHRLRLRRRRALDPGRHGHAGRAAVHRAGRAVRRLARLLGDLDVVRRFILQRAARPWPPAAFDQVGRQGTWPASRWTGQDIQGAMDKALPASAQGFTQAAGRLTVSGSGDIAPATDNIDSDQAHPGGDIRRADRRGGDRRHVHHRGVPARDDPDHVHGQPAARPGPGGQGDRAGRGHVRGRARRGRGHDPARRAPAARERQPDPAGHGAHLAAGRGRHGRAAGRGRRARAGRGHAAAAQCWGGHRGDRRHRAAVSARGHPRRSCRPAPSSGWSASPRRPRSLSSRASSSTPRSPRTIRRGTGTSRWRRGPGSRCCAPGPPLALVLALFLLRRRDA